MISAVTTISDCKIKVKSNKTLTKALIEALNKIFDESYMILSNFSDEIEVDQKTVFSSKNVIITEKIIFVLNVITQII